MELIPQPAVRASMPLRLGISGPAGSGKTRLALDMASELGGRICVVDTDKGSSRLFADDYPAGYDVAIVGKPFNPVAFADAFPQLEDSYDVIIVDGLTPFWNGTGGVLQIVDGAADSYGGNKAGGWAVGTPAHDAMVEALMQIDAHLIVTTRAKEGTLIEGGTVKRLGLEPVQRDSLEYELTVSLMLRPDHGFEVRKSRIQELDGRSFDVMEAPAMLQVVSQWLDSAPRLATERACQRLIDLLNILPDPEARKVAKRNVVGSWGSPADGTMLAADCRAAYTWTMNHYAKINAEKADQGVIAEVTVDTGPDLSTSGEGDVPSDERLAQSLARAKRRADNHRDGHEAAAVERERAQRSEEHAMMADPPQDLDLETGEIRMVGATTTLAPPTGTMTRA